MQAIPVSTCGDSMGDGLPWFAIHIRSRREEFVDSTLSNKGYETFLPMYPSRMTQAGKICLKQMPLFPGYVFCRFNSELLGKVVTTPGVIRIVSFAKTPAVIPTEEISRIQRISSCGLKREPWRYVPGSGIFCIETGPLKGVCGTLMSTPGSRRFVVSIGILQRSVAVVLGEDTEIRRVTNLAETISA